MASLQLAARPQLKIVPKRVAHNKLPLGDVENFSMARWLLAHDEEGKTGTPARHKAPWEARWYAAKAQGEPTGQDGGYLAPEEWRSEFYDIIRGAFALSKLPVEQFTTTARTSHIPMAWGQNAEWLVSYVTNVAIPSSDRTFAQHTYTMRKQGVLGKLSKDLIKDIDPALADLALKKSCGEAMAHDRDTQALIGNGQNGVPVGLLNQSFVGHNVMANDTGNGATPKYQDLAQAIATVRTIGQTVNAPIGTGICNGVVGAPRFAQTVDEMTDPNGRPLWHGGLNNEKDDPGQPRFMGIRNWIMTSNIPTNVMKGTALDTSYLFFGDWKMFTVMSRLDFEFKATDQPGADRDQFWVRGISRWDCIAVHPEAFVIVDGVRL